MSAETYSKLLKLLVEETFFYVNKHYPGALKCSGPGFCNVVSHPRKAYYLLCKYMSGNFQVRLVNQFKRCWGGSFKIWAAQAHSLSNLTGVTESSLVSLWSDPIANPTLCSVSDLCAVGTRPWVCYSKMNL